MQSVQIGDIAVHYSHRPATDGAPVIVFINSLGTDFRIWDEVIARLDPSNGVVAYDKRGHGLSSIGQVPYTMGDHARDLAGLLGHLHIPSAIICGLSIGGQIAQELYFTRPDLIEGMVLCGTAAKIGEPDFWRRRIDAIAANGLIPITETIMERWFSPGFRDPGNSRYELARAMFQRQPVEGYLASCSAIAGFDRSADTASIAVPVSVLVGALDGSTPPDEVHAFARAIPGVQFSIIEGAGHIPCLETPGEIAAAISGMVERLKGIQTRDR